MVSTHLSEVFIVHPLFFMDLCLFEGGYLYKVDRREFFILTTSFGTTSLLFSYLPGNSPWSTTDSFVSLFLSRFRTDLVSVQGALSLRGPGALEAVPCSGDR